MLPGVNFKIPLNNVTYKYCWQQIFLGLRVDIQNQQDEANENNNEEYFPIKFDCGGECVCVNFWNYAR